jgi:RNA-binding protein YhbY
MTHDARKGVNESLFRDVNERLERRAIAKLNDTERFEVLCECDREECTERIMISFAAYEAVRARPRAFIVVTGHTDPTFEHVAVEHGTYAVVEKFGEAGEVAEIQNPREGDEA